MTKECKQQFTLRISQANSTELVVILYEMLLTYLDEGEEAYKQDNMLAFREAIRKARGCINELINSLHTGYEPAPALLQLYIFCKNRLTACVIHKENYFGEIKRVIQPLRDAYAEIAKLNTQGAVMGNSQAVYAGLTYGKNTLTENMADQGANRGMLV